jgi:hypothetical protein
MGDRNEKGRAGHRRGLIPLLFMHLGLGFMQAPVLLCSRAGPTVPFFAPFSS